MVMQGAHRLLSVVWCALTLPALNPLVYGWTFTDKAMPPGRSLQAVAASDSASQVWQQGRASWTNPSADFISQLDKGQTYDPGAGSCNLYNGQNGSLASSVIVPLEMQAGLSLNNLEFAGSCGRCYEVRCVNGAVMGNNSADGARTNISLTALDQPSKHRKNTSMPLLDFLRRPFPGNALESADRLAGQCWEQPQASLGLSPTSLNQAQIIQITNEDGCNASQVPVSASCTNLVQFNLDFRAFQQMAHPGYGLINVEYRPVNCTAPQLPLKPSDGRISRTIIGDEGQLEPGWGLGPYMQDVTPPQIPQRLQSSVFGLGLNATATCFTFTQGIQQPVQAQGISFQCRKCDRPGLQPFSIASTSGISFRISSAIAAEGRYGISGNALPPLLVSLNNDDSSQKTMPVNLTRMPQPSMDTAMHTVTILYQDPTVLNATQDGAKAAAQFTDIKFEYDVKISPPRNVSFCLSELQLLPSQVNSSAGANVIPTDSRQQALRNCQLKDAQPVNKDGQFVDDVFPKIPNPSTTDYTAFQQAGMYDVYGVFPIGDNDTCSSSSHNNTDWTNVAECTKAITPPQCCYQFPKPTTNASLDWGEITRRMSTLCDGMMYHNATGNFICQGFTFDYSTGSSFFKVQLVDTFVDNDTYCNIPHVTSWTLNTALQEQHDSRAIATEARAATSDKASTWSLSKIWSIVGSVGAIASAGLALSLWVLLTNSYRLDRLMVIKQVAQHVSESDITAATEATTSANLASNGSIPNPLLDSVDTTDAGLIEGAVFGAAAGTMTRKGGVGAGEEVSKVATEITKRCLQRWDGFMRLRANTDSLGIRSGIWRSKFDCVRFASMLLAMRQYNENLKESHAGSLMQTWQQGNWKHQGMIITELCRVLQSISEEDAQALPLKDPETGGFQDKLCSMCHACGHCCPLKAKSK